MGERDYPRSQRSLLPADVVMGGKPGSMSDGPQPPGPPDPAASAPTMPQAARPQPATRPLAWPEQPAVPGQRASLEPSEWPEQPPAWPQSPGWPQPPAWPQSPGWPQPPAGPQPPPWRQSPAGPQPPPWPGQPAAPGPEPYGREVPTYERYAVRPPPERYEQRYGPAQQAQGWMPLPLPGLEMQPVTVAPKNPAVSVLLSLFIPGLGSMVNGNAGTGVTILALNILGWMLAIVLIGIPLAIGTWIWGLVDAYQSAQRWNRRHGIVS